jgi:hypothetical protein
MGKSVGLKLSLGATIILALAIVWVLLEPKLDGSDPDDAVKARETAGTESGDDARRASKSLELGAVAKISANYRIAVTEVARYETPAGQLIVPTIEATYIGTEDGEPWADLNVELHGLGSKTFGESDCPAGLGHTEATEQPTLDAGDDETYDVCIAAPTKSVKGGKILVEEAFSTDDATFWSIKGAVTKTLPSVAAPPATKAPATGYQPRRQPDADHDGGSANCDEWDQDKYEDSKERAEYYEDYYEEHKGDLDDETIDEYKEWKEDHDKMVDYYEKWDEACD